MSVWLWWISLRILKSISHLEEQWYFQWCGSTLIVCGSGYTKFYECASGSKFGSSPYPGQWNHQIDFNPPNKKPTKIISNLYLKLRDYLLLKRLPFVLYLRIWFRIHGPNWMRIHVTGLFSAFCRWDEPALNLWLEIWRFETSLSAVKDLVVKYKQNKTV